MTRDSCLTPKTAFLRFLSSSEGAGEPVAPIPALLVSLALAFLLILNPGVSTDASALRPVQEVRGWAITNLIRFSYWPDRAYESESQPTIVCAPPGEVALPPPGSGIAGDPTFLHGRQVVLREISDYSDIEPCHVIFFPAEELETFKWVCEELRGEPVVFVSDKPGFASMGGSFELVMKEDYAFFRFNRGTLMESGIDLAQALMRMGSMPSHLGGAL
jgi:hypothetical protein